MNWIELIQLRAYSQGDREAAVNAFHELSFKNIHGRLMDIRLFGNHTLQNDLIICMNWRGEIPKEGKTPLGLQLAAAFSQFGRFHHAIWTGRGKQNVNERRQNP